MSVALSTIDSTLEKMFSRSFISITTVVILGLILRIYFTPWHLPSNSPDAFVYLVESISFSKGDFSYMSYRALWPLFLSIFFTFLKFDDYFGYFTIMRIVSICVSVSTVSVLYLIARYFVEKKFAIMAAVFFTLESNLVENSIFAISEPIFILLGLLSFFFIIQKTEKYALLSFVFAGLAFNTRLNGIVLFLLLVIVYIMKIKQTKKTVKMLLIGIGIFIIISSPHIFVPLSNGGIPFFSYFSLIGNVVSTGSVFVSTYDSSQDHSSFGILSNAMKNEFLQFFRINVPYLAIFFPFGVIVALKNIDYQKKILFLVIIISLIIALPQYTISSEYRNLFFITPFLCILSSIGIQKIVANVEMKNIFLFLLVGGLVLLSTNFLMERYDVDYQLVTEKEQFGKFVINNFNGRVMGDEYNEIAHSIPNASLGGDDSGAVFNDRFSIVWPQNPIDTSENLIHYISSRNVDYLIVDSTYNKRFPIFADVFFNERNYTFLEKAFDSSEHGYHKLRVKIFKINHDVIEKQS